jgi:hypothetical protein
MGEFPTPKKLVVEVQEAVRFSDSKVSILRILNNKRCNDSRKLLRELNGIVVAGSVFLRKTCEIRHSDRAHVQGHNLGQPKPHKKELLEDK